MLRVKQGAWAPLRVISMLSYPATGMTCMEVMTGEETDIDNLRVQSKSKGGTGISACAAHQKGADRFKDWNKRNEGKNVRKNGRKRI